MDSKWNKEKLKLEKLILEEKKSYEEIGAILGKLGIQKIP